MTVYVDWVDFGVSDCVLCITQCKLMLKLLHETWFWRLDKNSTFAVSYSRLYFRTWGLVCIKLSFASREFVCARSTAFAQ